MCVWCMQSNNLTIVGIPIKWNRKSSYVSLIGCSNLLFVYKIVNKQFYSKHSINMQISNNINQELFDDYVEVGLFKKMIS